MSPPPLAALMNASRHDLIDVSVAGDPAHAVHEAEPLDCRSGGAAGFGHLLLGVRSLPNVDAVLGNTAAYASVLAVKARLTLLATHPGNGPVGGGDLFAPANSVAAVVGGTVAIMDTRPGDLRLLEPRPWVADTESEGVVRTMTLDDGDALWYWNGRVSRTKNIPQQASRPPAPSATKSPP